MSTVGIAPPMIDMDKNVQLAQQMNSLYQMARSLAYANSSQSIISGSPVALSFNVNMFDVGGNKKSIHSTAVNPTRFTAPFRGLYLIFGQCYITGIAILEAYVNGNHLSPNIVSVDQQVLGITQLNAEDYVEYFVTQSSGSSQSTVALQTLGSLTCLTKI